jgi:hypothetical protein
MAGKEKLFAFVLMPFDEAFSDVYRLGIKETLETRGIIAERVDEQVFHKENILERIYNQINASDFLVAEMSGRNPNVFYEVGYADAKNKLCILITSDANDIPFDLKHHRHIAYGNSISTLRKQLLTEIDWIEASISQLTLPIQCQMHEPAAELTKTKYFADVEVVFTFDFYNNSNHNTEDIDALYFYSGDGWKFTQDDQECLSTRSDKDGFKLRHMIRMPVRRIERNGGWAQIKLKGKKTIASTFKGQKLVDKYRLTGPAMVKIVMRENVLDYRFDLDFETEEFPF